MHLKFIEGSETEIEGLLLPFGGPFQGKDLSGEAFSVKTDFCLNWYPEGTTRPLLYNHGLADGTGVSPVGRIKSIDVRDNGGWMRAQLDANSQYFESIKKLIEDGTLHLSSGAMSHLVKLDRKSGLISQWPVVEGSLTPTPCNPLAQVDFATAEKHYKSAGVDFDALKAKMDQAEKDALPDSDFAYIDADGNRKLPINDAEHVRAALSRFNQTEFASDTEKEAARAKILARAKKFGISVSEDSAVGGGKSWDELAEVPVDQWAGIKLHADGTFTATKAADGSYEDLLQDLESLLNPITPYETSCYSCILGTYDGYMIVRRYEQDPDSDFQDVDETFWRVEYTINDDGDPALGTATQVDQTFVPHKSIVSDNPLTLDAQSLARHAGALAQRTEGLHERRVKEGRVLSGVNRKSLADAVKTLDSAKETIQSLLDASDRILSESAKAAALSSPDSLHDRFQLLEIFCEIESL